MSSTTIGGYAISFDEKTSKFTLDGETLSRAGAIKSVKEMIVGVHIASEADKTKLLKWIGAQKTATTEHLAPETVKPAQETANRKPETTRGTTAVPPIKVDVADALKAGGDLKVLFDTNKGFTPNLSVRQAFRKEVFDRLYAQMLLQRDFIQFITQFDGLETPAKQKVAPLDVKVQVMRLFFQQNNQKVEGEADIVAKTMKKLYPSFANPFGTVEEKPKVQVKFGGLGI